MAMKTYRHQASGLVADYPEEFAAQFPDLIEVEPGTKPLAYTPIPQSEVDAVLAQQAEDAASTEETAA